MVIHANSDQMIWQCVVILYYLIHKNTQQLIYACILLANDVCLYIDNSDIYPLR